MYKVIGMPQSRSFRVYWILEELGQKYDFIAAAPHAPEIKILNPTGKVPCLLVDDEPIFDSVAIIQFLADKHTALTFPAGTVKRAQQDSFTQFCVDEVEGALWTAAKNTFALPEKVRVPAIKETARYEFARAMRALEARLGDNEFVMGDTFTVPDLLLGHCAKWATAAKFDLPTGLVSAYFERIASREAYVRTTKLAISSS